MSNTSASEQSTDRSFAAEVRAEMARREITQSALADMLDVHPVWVSRRLTGAVEMSLNDAALLADALGLSLPEVLGRLS